MNEELSAEERQALDALPREVTPPPELEDRTVQALKGRGTLHQRQGTGGWPRMLAVAAAAVLLLAGGAAAGRWTAAHREIELRAGVTDEQAVAMFTFINQGDKPVTITSVKSSCGCTSAVVQQGLGPVFDPEAQTRRGAKALGDLDAKNEEGGAKREERRTLKLD